MHRVARITLLAALALSAIAPGAAHAVAIFTSLAEMTAAAGAGPTLTDNLGGVRQNSRGVQITFPSGITSTASGAGRNHARTYNTAIGGYYVGAVDGDGSNAPERITWTLESPVFGFAVNIARLSGADNSGVDISIDEGATFSSLRTLLGGADGFFGLLSSTPEIRSIVFRNLTNDHRRGVIVADDIFQFADNAAAVPSPAGSVLLALACVGLLRRRRPGSTA